MPMTTERTDNNRVFTRMELPPYEPDSEEELERRRALFDRTMTLRDRIGPIGTSVADLIREVRDEADEDSFAISPVYSSICCGRISRDEIGSSRRGVS